MCAKLVCGVGTNDSETNINERITIGYVNGKQKQKIIWSCPFYIVWADMLKRCYSEKYLAKYPTYSGCRVCDDWIYFSKFRSWMQSQDWQGKELDKDIICMGNKVYGPDLCVFVDKIVNYAVLTNGSRRGEFPLGVSSTKSGKYRAECNYMGEYRYLGVFSDVHAAHKAWKAAKIHSLSNLIKTQSDPRIIRGIEFRINLLQESINTNTEITRL